MAYSIKQIITKNKKIHGGNMRALVTDGIKKALRLIELGKKNGGIINITWLSGNTQSIGSTIGRLIRVENNYFVITDEVILTFLLSDISFFDSTGIVVMTHDKERKIYAQLKLEPSTKIKI